ncbi:hypothetical protein ACE01N_19700 [Saccharicrinis sp. FJH2]|uniref:hypothetical protein n=1 Tax=Saccharicrinis sp. FJH65 TaxID=3344659 RepID=UPI0035F2950A
MRIRNYLLICLLALISCTENNEEIIKEVLIPLSVGNEWIYESSKPSSSIIKEQTQTIVKDTSVLIDGESYKAYILIAYENITDENKFNIYWGHDSEGNLIQYGGKYLGSSVIDKSIQFKKDVSAGDSWNYNHIIYSGDEGLVARSSNIECINTDTLITTKAGNFNCVHLKEGSMFEYFVDSEIGIIKRILLNDGEISSEISLKEYSINE